MKVLITGGAGFIGSHLAEYLLGRGEKVEVLDDLSSGELQNIAAIKGHPNFSCVIDSVLNREALKKLIKRNDFIFHLAAAVGVKMVIEEPIKSIKINVEGTQNILEFACRFKKKVLLASTSEVYGKNEKIPFSEESSFLLGSTEIRRWSYACTKLLDEFLSFAYFQKEGLPVIVVRLFNTIGPRQSGEYGMVVPRFIKQALNGEPITVYGDGKQLRCFTDVSDVVEVMASLAKEPRAFGKVFNIGNPKTAISINELAKLIKKLTKSKSKIIHIPYQRAYREGFVDMEKRVPDIGKIQRLINFSPKVNLPEALTKIIEYHRDIVLSSQRQPRLATTKMANQGWQLHKKM